MNVTSTMRAFLVGLAVGVVGYFFNAADGEVLGMNATGLSWIVLASGGLLGSFLVHRLWKVPVSRGALLVYVGVMAGVVAHIVYDEAFGSVSHNLFPLELIGLSVVVLPAVFIGSFLSLLVQKAQ